MPRHDNSANLRPPFTPEEAREYGRKGAEASAKVRRRKKEHLEIVRRVLESDITGDVRDKIEKITGKLENDEADLFTAIVAMQAKEALKGSTAAFNALCAQMQSASETVAAEVMEDDELTKSLRELGESL